LRGFLSFSLAAFSNNPMLATPPSTSNKVEAKLAYKLLA
jgi:hypothetical protein